MFVASIWFAIVCRLEHAIMVLVMMVIVTVIVVVIVMVTVIVMMMMMVVHLSLRSCSVMKNDGVTVML
jgi:hypothetical protein